MVPNIVEDYTIQVINEYQEYIDSLNKRWDYDDQVNTFTINVDDVDWEKLEEQDTILTEQAIKEIYEQVVLFALEGAGCLSSGRGREHYDVTFGNRCVVLCNPRGRSSFTIC